MPRAFLRVGGVTVARQQLALALELKCERIICFAAALSGEVLELQHLAEAAGASFHVIGQARALSGLVTAVDEVVALSDGLFVSIPQAAALLEEGQAVLVQPIEQGLAGGFERIDLNHAAAGAMRLPGRLIERLVELPADCDAASALQRIALQAGIRQRAIPTPGQDGLFWTLVRSEDEAHALEPQWIRQRTQDEGALSPSRGVALFAVRSLGPAMLHAGSGARALVIAAALMALLALGSGWFNLLTLGLGFAALGWLLRECAVLLARIETESPHRRAGLDSKEIYGWLTDGIIVVLTALAVEAHAGQHFIDRLFPPFMLVALLRILPRLVSPRWAAWFGDRALLALVLGGAVASGAGSAAVHIAAALAALAGIVLPMAQSRLTRP
ncbi:MAG TPA: hypothetical protein VFV30_05720 [Novosphingobium sp.]|nr:hypothetical protein [Novosphingobium sp.]